MGNKKMLYQSYKMTKTSTTKKADYGNFRTPQIPGTSYSP